MVDNFHVNFVVIIYGIMFTFLIFYTIYILCKYIEDYFSDFFLFLQIFRYFISRQRRKSLINCIRQSSLSGLMKCKTDYLLSHPILLEFMKTFFFCILLVDESASRMINSFKIHLLIFN